MNPAWGLANFRVDGEAQRAQDRAGSALDATDPDIGRFVARVGKLIL